MRQFLFANELDQYGGFDGIIYQAKKQLNRSVSVMQNQTKCERLMQEMVNISGSCAYNEIIVV